MSMTRADGIINVFIEDSVLAPIEIFAQNMPIVALIVGIILFIAATILMAVVFQKHEQGMWKAFVPILNICVLFKIAWNTIVAIPYVLVGAFILLAYSKGYTALLDIENALYGVGDNGEAYTASPLFHMFIPYAVLFFVVLTVVLIIKAIISVNKVEYVYDTPEDDSDDAELQPPGACLDAPLTAREREIAQNIREKKRMGQNNFTAEEKAVLHKLAWQKEYGMSKGE